jgi:hypothetical protein
MNVKVACVSMGYSICIKIGAAGAGMQPLGVNEKLLG